ncbi:Fic family protein [bacterium]|nr:Fic family protein [bacterium]
MTLREKLKLAQKAARISQEGLARELGVSFATLNSWINGRSVPRPRARERIDQLYLRITGQNVIPEEALEAKKLILEKKSGQNRHVLQLIVKNKDIYDQFMLTLTYHTNRIEGSTLTEPETAAILFEDTALPNKSMIEQLEVKNHQAAMNFTYRRLVERERLDESFILRLHGILMNGIKDDAGAYRNHNVRIAGANVPTANYMKVPHLMREIIKDTIRKPQDIIERATRVHSRFEQIHPFSDGNGRVGRLLLNAMLLEQHYPPAIIKQELRRFYILYLGKSQLEDDFSLLEDFICDAIMEGFKILDRAGS